jgi:hypothetical protein
MRWDVTKAIIYRIRAQGNWGPSLILFVCFQFTSLLRADCCAYGLRKGGKEGPGNLSLVFLLGCFSPSLSFLYITIWFSEILSLFAGSFCLLD